MTQVVSEISRGHRRGTLAKQALIVQVQRGLLHLHDAEDRRTIRK